MSKHRHTTTRQPVRPAAGAVLSSGRLDAAAVLCGARADAAAVLAVARDSRRIADEHEARILATAVDWARLHPVSDTDGDAAAQWSIPGVGREGLMIAGEGAPLVAEWCIAELASVLGLSTDAGMALVGEALELAYRLPRLWARVQAGEVTAWRARRVATQTIRLTAEAADHVGRHVAPFAHSISGPGIERLVADAMARFMPQTAEEATARAADRRCFEIDHQQVSCHRTARRADIDHITPWHQGGPTSTENLAALCRRHHRYKTHHGWTYHRTGPATYQWRSPHGYHYTVTPAGTAPTEPPTRHSAAHRHRRTS